MYLVETPAIIAGGILYASFVLGFRIYVPPLVFVFFISNGLREAGAFFVKKINK